MHACCCEELNRIINVPSAQNTNSCVYVGKASRYKRNECCCEALNTTMDVLNTQSTDNCVPG